MVNVNKLKGKIVERGTSVSELARKIGMTPATFYRKLSDKGDDFTIKQANSIASVLELTCDEINEIFFAQSVAEMR